MTSTSTIGSNSFLDGLSIDKKNQTASETKESDKDMFMRLMLAQLENQNPLQPQDGAEFLSQLAQFTQVEGISKLNTSMTDITSLYRSTQALQATALVGRNVQVVGNGGYFDGTNDMGGTISAGQAATNVTMTVKNSVGSVVATYDVGSISSEATDFAWDGTDSAGKPVNAGNYTIGMEGVIGGKRVALETAMNIRVNSVSILENNNGMMLNLANGSSVNADKVKEIL